MKALLTSLLFLMSIIVVSCNNTDKNKNDNATDSVATSKPEAVAPAIDDPDPTDSVPGDRYPANASSKTTAELIRNVLVNDILKDDLKTMDSADRKFIFSELDLNGDGKNEIFVGFTGSYFCGTGGCQALLLNPEGKKITHFSITEYPIVVYPAVTKGWKDLVISSKGIPYRIKWDGTKYPSNPSMQPKFKDLPSDEAARVLDFVQFPYPWFRF